jgi:hypothetical protein
MTIHSGEWPWRTFTLVAFNDLIWWLPFTLFLLEGTNVAKFLRATAPWVCSVTNAGAALAMLLVLRFGTEAEPNVAVRASYIAEHAVAWRAGWGIWMVAGLSMVAFYAWWGASIPSSRLAIGAFLVASAGLVCDFFAESLFIGWLPNDIESCRLARHALHRRRLLMPATRWQALRSPSDRLFWVDGCVGLRGWSGSVVFA